MTIILVVMLLVISATNAFDWQSGNNGQVRWAFNCDFSGNDIRSQSSSGADCGGLCVSNQQCTHFTHWNGVCYMKKANNPTASNLNGGVCGWIDHRGNSTPTRLREDVNLRIWFKLLIDGGGGGGGESGVTTRYWDCCKVSCAWSGNVAGGKNVNSCNKDGVSIADKNVQSGCGGGPSYACSNNQPITVNDNLSYGFAAFSRPNSCCKCYQLTFTNTAVAGKTMIVQATNTGSDLGQGHFDLMIPGGGVGIFNGCSAQWGAPSPNGWGQKYGGVSSRDQCNQLPSQLRQGCYWRFDWFKNADNPNVNFKEVSCPSKLTSISGCQV